MTSETPKMTAIELEALCDMLLVSDPFPLPEYVHQILLDFANAESQRRGFSDWSDALHNIGALAEEEKRLGGQFGVGA